MVRTCPHCGASGVMGGALYKRRFVLICPRCDDRFYPAEAYV